ncbi:MAG: NAD(+)/NADH kinase [Eubacteriales bacterium]|nr:NAD(+)/NADH kinase [Eubacteriales bacterium]
MNVFVYGDSANPATSQAAKPILEILRRRCVTAVAQPGLGDGLTLEHMLDAEILSRTDLIICLGGDGTIMRAARLQLGHAVPILGVNTGRVGFLAGIEPSEIQEGVNAAIDGKGVVEERLVLRASASSWEAFAINDVSLNKAPDRSLLSFEVRCDGEMMCRFRADGAVVASPTGSTAYSLSAGGPIAMPNADCIIMTPLCAHTLGAGSIVINGSSVLSLCADAPTPVFVDGIAMPPCDRIEVKKADFTAKIIRLYERDYYSLLHKKLSIKD